MPPGAGRTGHEELACAALACGRACAASCAAEAVASGKQRSRRGRGARAPTRDSIGGKAAGTPNFPLKEVTFWKENCQIGRSLSAISPPLRPLPAGQPTPQHHLRKGRGGVGSSRRPNRGVGVGRVRQSNGAPAAWRMKRSPRSLRSACPWSPSGEYHARRRRLTRRRRCGASWRSGWRARRPGCSFS